MTGSGFAMTAKLLHGRIIGAVLRARKAMASISPGARDSAEEATQDRLTVAWVASLAQVSVIRSISQGFTESRRTSGCWAVWTMSSSKLLRAPVGRLTIFMCGRMSVVVGQKFEVRRDGIYEVKEPSESS
jgi:hypothetical protein